MASNSSTLVVRFLANTTNLQRGVRQAGVDLGKFGQVAKAAGIAAAAAFAAGPVIDAIGSSIKAFSDYNEAVNKTSVLFGEAQDSILSFSNTAAQALGLSKTEALEAAGTFKIYADTIGLTAEQGAIFSKQFVEIASDLASIQNTSTVDALRAIESALAGQSRPLRRYAIDVSDAAQKQELLNAGLYSGTGDLTAQEKVMGVYLATLNGAAYAQGDFARTSEDLANQSRRLVSTFKDLQIAAGEGLLAGLGNEETKGLLEEVIKLLEALQPAVFEVGKAAGESTPNLERYVRSIRYLAEKVPWDKLPSFNIGNILTVGIQSVGQAIPVIDLFADGMDRLISQTDLFVAAESRKQSALSGTVSAALAAGNAMSYYQRQASLASVAFDPDAYRDSQRGAILTRLYGSAGIWSTTPDDQIAKTTAGVSRLGEALKDIDAQSFEIGPLEITFGKLKDLTSEDASGINAALRDFVDQWEDTWDGYESSLKDAQRYVEEWQRDLISGLDIGKAFTLANDADAREADALKRLNSILADPNASAQSVSDARNAYYEAAAEAATSWQEGFAKQLRDAGSFYEALGNLKDSGLNEALVRQVAALGPGVGTALAQELVGDTGLIGTLNSDWVKVEKAALDLGIGMSDTFQDIGISNAEAQVQAFQKQLRKDAPRVVRQIEKDFAATVRIKYVADTSGLPNIGSNGTSVRQGGFTSSTSRGRQIVEDIQAFELVSGSSWRV